MFKVVHFFYIFVLLNIANMIIAEVKNCTKVLSDANACNNKKWENTTVFRQCVHQALELMDGNGQFIVPRTSNEKLLISHVKAFETCMRQSMLVHSELGKENNGNYSIECGAMCIIKLYPAVQEAYATSYGCSLPN